MRSQAIGEALRAYRRERGWTQDELIEHVTGTEVTRRSIYRIETGQSAPSAVLLWALADALEVTLSDLIKRAEGMAEENLPED